MDRSAARPKRMNVRLAGESVGVLGAKGWTPRCLSQLLGGCWAACAGPQRLDDPSSSLEHPEEAGCKLVRSATRPREICAICCASAIVGVHTPRCGLLPFAPQSLGLRSIDSEPIISIDQSTAPLDRRSIRACIIPSFFQPSGTEIRCLDRSNGLARRCRSRSAHERPGGGGATDVITALGVVGHMEYAEEDGSAPSGMGMGRVLWGAAGVGRHPSGKKAKKKENCRMGRCDAFCLGALAARQFSFDR